MKMTPQQEAQRLRKEFGEKAVKVVDELIRVSLSKFNLNHWQQVKSELQKPVNDPFIDEVEEFHPILKKIRDMMKDLKPWISYDQLKVSDLPPIETFATCNGVGRRSITHYTDGYEKYRAVPND